MSVFRREVQAVLKGFRNGVEYGTKVRFVHTLVMTLLFKDIHLSKLPALLKAILAMAVEHGKNLGLFVLTYKSGYKCLNYLRGVHSSHHFLSGLLFGTLIFGKKTGINNQIVLYLFSRVMISLVTLGYGQLKRGGLEWGLVEKGYFYYVLAGVCWGVVMWLFERDRGLLQTSLSNSMEFLYKESDCVGGWTDLIPYYPKEDKGRKCTKVSKKDIRR